MLLGILLALHILVCVALIGVVLLQRSEGGWLGGGGGPGGFLTARGGGDLLTRTTWILGTVFFLLSLSLTMLSGGPRDGGSVADRYEIERIDPNQLNQPAGPAAPAAPESGAAPAEAPRPTIRNPLAAPAEQPAPQP